MFRVEILKILDKTYPDARYYLNFKTHIDLLVAAILSSNFDIVDGVVVDTHVLRVSYRLGWTKETNPAKVERDLNKSIEKQWLKKMQWLLKPRKSTEQAVNCVDFRWSQESSHVKNHR